MKLLGGQEQLIEADGRPGAVEAAGRPGAIG